MSGPQASAQVRTVTVLRALAVVGVVSSLAASAVQPASGDGSTACRATAVHYTPYPGGAPGLARLPWIAGGPARLGLVALLWYWPKEWRTQHVPRARIYTRGEAPAGVSTKILWAFLSTTAKRSYSRGGDGQLVVKGERLDAPGRTWQHFAAISYEGQNGAPSFASIVSLPSPGCWRVDLAAGGLHASVVVRAVPG
jgi:hypothetical protein